MKIDPEYFDEVSRTAAAALQTFGELAPSLASREVEERSPDGRIIVRVTAGGTITAITLRDGVLRRYDSESPGRAGRQDAQRRAAASPRRLRKRADGRHPRRGSRGQPHDPRLRPRHHLNGGHAVTPARRGWVASGDGGLGGPRRR